MSEAIGRRHGMSRGHLQPLRVLVEHRVDDVDEGLVAVEEAVPAGEQVALEPALAQVLGQHLHHPAVGREVLVVGEDLGVTRRGPSPRRRRRAGSRRSRRARRGGSCPGCGRITSRRNAPSTRVASLIVAPGARHVDRVVAEVGQRRGRAAAGRRWRAGSRSSAGSSSGASAASSGTSAPSLVEELLRPVAPHPRPRAARGAPGSSRTSRQRHLVRAPACPRPAARRPPSGRSSPSACAARSSASAGARSRRPRGRALLDRARSRRALVERGRHRWCTCGRVVAVDEVADRWP